MAASTKKKRARARQQLLARLESMPLDSTWDRIGSAYGHRSGWMHTVYSETEPGRIELVALRAGRDGDDAFLVIDRSNPQLEAIHDVLSTMRFAVEHEPMTPQARSELKRWSAERTRLLKAKRRDQQPPRRPHADRRYHRRA